MLSIRWMKRESQLQVRHLSSCKFALSFAYEFSDLEVEKAIARLKTMGLDF